MNSCRKGKVGEREWRDVMRENGFLQARRTQQFCGTAGDSDVTCPELPNFHWEVKRVEKLNLNDAMAQAIRDCGSKMPVVAHRKNNCPWLVTVTADVFFKLIRESEQIKSI